MNNIVIDNVLKAIHYILEHNGFKFTEKQISLADDFITPFIDDLEIDPKEFNVVTIGVPKLVTDKRIMPICTKYFAFIEDNMGLYTELKKEDYIFYENYSIKFYALDRMLTGNFNKGEYIRLLSKYEKVISKFYSSIRGLESSEKEKYCRDFSDVVLRDQTTLKVGCSDDNYNFLIKRNFLLFGKDFLLKLNDKQREMINNICINLTEEEAIKLKELFTIYPLYTSNIDFSSEILKSFSVEEIGLMSSKDYSLYAEAIKVGLLERVKNILSLDPEFNCPINFIKEEIFRVLTDEQIIGLSDEAKKEIISVIPEIDNVLVMPIKKINKIVSRDEKKKNNNETTGSITK